jgi:hydrogenase small subunit
MLGFSLVKLPGVDQPAQAAAPQKVAEIPVLWMSTGSCSGCSVSLLNSASPSIQELLLGQVLPGSHLSLGFHATVMAAAGEMAMDTLKQYANDHKGKYVLVVDGATASKEEGIYCAIGETKDGKPITGYRHVRDLGRNALAVLAVGSCSSFGGIPAAGPNPTEALSVQDLYSRERITTPVANIPGCPPHPDWIVGSVASLLLGGVEALKLDEQGRPGAFFSECIHDNCAYRGHFDKGDFAEHFGEHGCLVKLGCKGPITYADCPTRKFNNGTNWCVEAGHPCIGCCHPEFPFETSLFTPVEAAALNFPDVYPIGEGIEARKQADADTYATVGLIGVSGFLAGVGVATAACKLKSQHAEEQETNANTP